MPINLIEKTIKTEGAFIKLFKNKLIENKNNEQWIYRGQSDYTWNLETSLERVIYDFDEDIIRNAGLKDKSKMAQLKENALKKSYKDRNGGNKDISLIENDLIREFKRKSYHYIETPIGKTKKKY